MPVTLTIDVERERDGRWMADVPELPGVLAYGDTESSAVATAEALALRVFAERGFCPWDLAVMGHTQPAGPW